MATEKQIAANRANALKSTGPRSKSGRARSSKNALIHGFSSKSNKLEDSFELSAAIRKLAGPSAHKGQEDAALKIILGSLKLRRINEFRNSYLKLIEDSDPIEKVNYTRRLLSLDRYERSAHAMVKEAIKKLDEQ